MASAREHFRLEEIADGVHAAVATDDGFGLCNAAIVDLGGSTLVFDAMLTLEAGEALAHTARRLTGRPVDLLVNSHYHGDHVRGNAAVGAQHIVSTHRVRELVLERAAAHLRADQEEAPAELRSLERGEATRNGRDRVVREAWMRGILATPADLRVPPPDLTFTDELVARGTRRTARILSFGGGHSPSDVLVHLPEDRIGFLGDLLSVGFHPSLSDGDIPQLDRILARVQTLSIERTLPGHGPVAGAEDLRTMRSYVAAVRRQAAGARDEGLKRAELSRLVPEPPFGDWVFPQMFLASLEWIYDALPETSAAAPGAGNRRMPAPP